MSLHLDRARAESFGTVADDYDRYRPPCAPTLLDALAEARPAHSLDVACGTGRVTAALAARGLDVLGVEIDPEMAARARRRGVAVEVSAFETWDDAGRRFDLIVCTDAWHWLDPDVAAAKAARLLRPGGTLVRSASFDVVDEPLASRLAGIYAEHGSGAHVAGLSQPRGDADAPRGWHDAFTAQETRLDRWERTLDADGWLQLLATFSDHRRLGAERLAALQGALRAAIDELGGTVRSRGATLSWHARVAR